ncbi:unnamed protein product [Camellia sinensis]
MGTHISISHRPTELPRQETGRVLSARLMCSEEIYRHSLSLFRRRQRSRRVEFLCCHQQPQTPSEGLPMIIIILFFLDVFLGANRITCEKKMEKIQSSTRKHTERERERERGLLIWEVKSSAPMIFDLCERKRDHLFGLQRGATTLKNIPISLRGASFILRA